MSKAKRAERDIDTILRCINEFTITHPDGSSVIADLARRARYPLRGSRNNDNTGRTKGDISDPTAHEALQYLPAPWCEGACDHDHSNDTWREPPDPIRAAINELYRDLDTAAGVLVRALNRLKYVTSTTGRGVDQQAGGQCHACLRWVAGGDADPLRSGYCNACRMAWDRAGRPDRGEFERGRQARQQEAS